jgi:glycosyltransferase involved in cell wall biosynthesis
VNPDSAVPRITRATPRPRVAFIAPFEPWCRENGSSVVIADLLAGLGEADRAELLPVFIRNPPPGTVRSRPPALEGITLGVEPLAKWYSVPLAVLTGRSPWWEVRFNNRRLARRIEQHIRASHFVPTLIHVEHLVLVDIGRFLARSFHAPLVYRAHNIESQLWRRRVGDRGKIVDGFLRHLERRELAAIEGCDLTLCISELDREWVSRNAPRARVDVLPVGLAMDRFLRRDLEVVGQQIAFVGGLDWPPNEVGLRWFVEHVFPRVRAAAPQVKLAVLARGAPERPWLRDHPAVELMPQTTDAAALFSASQASIAPLMEGGGVRIKIIESLAAGCPVVATPIGGEGLALSGLTHTADPERFAAACLRHLSRSDRSSREAVQSNVSGVHEAGVVVRKLAGFWGECERAGRPMQRVTGDPSEVRAAGAERA